MPAQKCKKDLEEDTGVDVGDSGMDHRHIYIDLEDESVTEYAEQRTIEPAASVGAASAALTGGSEATTEEENDWVMGADGYWWYHDKDTNEWWYKDENGDIVKFS